MNPFILPLPLVAINSLLCAVLVAGANVPEEIAQTYSPSPSMKVSDEFNGKALDMDKWAYRMKYGGAEDWGEGEDYISLETEGKTNYVAIRGNWEEMKGSGLSGKEMADFGFYMTRWRTSGIEPHKKTPWHPAIWMAAHNFAQGEDEKKIPEVPRNLEIDFMEYWHQPIWHVQTIAWAQGKQLDVQIMRPKAKDFPTQRTGWLIQGLEYTPDYLQAWEYNEQGWTKVGKPIPFVEEETTETKLNKGHAQPGYWILSNKHHWTAIKEHYNSNPKLDEFLFVDSSLDIDFFRFYPMKK